MSKNNELLKRLDLIINEDYFDFESATKYDLNLKKCVSFVCTNLRTFLNSQKLNTY